MTNKDPDKRKSRLLLVLGLIVALAVLALLYAGFVEPGFLTEEDDGIRMREDVDAVIMPEEDVDPSEIEE